MHPAQANLEKLRAEDRRLENQRRLIQAEADTRRRVREQETRARRDSAAHATPPDDCSVLFVPAPVYEDPTPSYSGGGGSFDGGGASGDY